MADNETVEDNKNEEPTEKTETPAEKKEEVPSETPAEKKVDGEEVEKPDVNLADLLLTLPKTDDKDDDKDDEREEDDEDEERKAEDVVEEEEKAVEEDPRDLLTMQERQEYTKIFQTYAVDKPKSVPTEQMGFIMRTMGLNPRQYEIQRIKVKVDPNDTGVMDLEAFLLFMCYLTDISTVTQAEVIAAFQILDKENNGYVETEDLKQVLRTMGEPFSYEEMECMIKQGDKKKTGKIHYKTFIQKYFPKEKKKKKSKKKDKKKGKGKGKKK